MFVDTHEAPNGRCSSEHGKASTLCVICIHVKETGDWWGVPAEDGQLDWMCSRCIEKFRIGECPRLDEITGVCSVCLRQMQKHARLHYPTENVDGSWRYDEASDHNSSEGQK